MGTVMQPPLEHLGARSRASAGQAAWFVAVCAASAGLASGVLMGLGLLLRQDAAGSGGLLQSLAPAPAVVSWVLSVAAVLTAATVLEGDRSARRARTALAVALPGALAGTVAMVLIVVWLAATGPLP